MGAPLQGWRYWAKWLACFALLGLIAMGAVGIGMRFMDVQLAVPGTSLTDDLLYGVLLSPIVEELVCRLVLCGALERIIGRWPALLVSALLFAALHWIYGNIAITNVVSGLVLAWVFLKSRSIWVPLLLHSIINAMITGFGLVLKTIYF